MKQIWNEDFNAGYELGYKDGESSAHADATAKYEDELLELQRELREAHQEIGYLESQLESAENYRCNCGEGY